MTPRERAAVGILGGGSSGLTAARNLLQAGFTVEILEREQDIGGNWNYDTPAARVYESTRMISSKPLTQFPDFPMPADFPDYPTHRQTLSYLRSYADHFGLHSAIVYAVSVDRVERTGGARPWRVILSNGEARAYEAVVVATGHNWHPHIPAYSGSFTGTAMHSAQYRTPDVFTGKRVLVVGRGNSGCDIAVEAAAHAGRVVSSGRRGYHFIPRYLMGSPSDQLGEALLRRGLALRQRRRITHQALERELGKLSDSGLPEPDHELFESHPVINESFPAAVRDGRIALRPDVASFQGNSATFSDGATETFDVVVFATGYEATAPFFTEPVADWWTAGRPRLYLNAFHPELDDLFFAGLIQPDSGQFGLVHWQARAIAAFLSALKQRRESAAGFKARKRNPAPATNGGIRYLQTQRHSLEVEHWSYRRALQAEIEALEQ